MYSKLIQAFINESSDIGETFQITSWIKEIFIFYSWLIAVIILYFEKIIIEQFIFARFQFLNN